MGIQAFEARWRALTKDHPTTKNDNTAIAQAMAQLIDQYQSPQQVEAALPEHLKLLFRELAIAYFQGCRLGLGASNWAGDAAPAAIAEPPPAAAVEIAPAVEQVRRLCQQHRRATAAHNRASAEDPSETETLIIEFPNGWPRYS
jgi:hypothetical protein